jgi:RNase H-fold protein (predicted Holliday junction resolvase)
VPVSHEGGEALIRAIVAAAREQVGERGRLEVVVGLPLVQEGKEGPRAKQVRAFAERVRVAMHWRRR